MIKSNFDNQSEIYSFLIGFFCEKILIRNQTT